MSSTSQAFGPNAPAPAAALWPDEPPVPSPPSSPPLLALMAPSAYWDAPARTVFREGAAASGDPGAVGPGLVTRRWAVIRVAPGPRPTDYCVGYTPMQPSDYLALLIFGAGA